MARVATIFVLVAVLVYRNDAQTDASSENGIPDSSSACATEFLEWCRTKWEKSAGQMHFGISILSSNYFNGEESIRIFCVSNNSVGINCTKNGSPWYFCFSNGTLQYKGKELTADSGDDDVCHAKERAKNNFPNYNDMEFNQTAFEDGMKLFRERMNQFQQHMRDLHKRLQFSMPTNSFRRNEDP